MLPDEDDNEGGRNWHISRSISIGHIWTTVLLGCSVLWYAADQNTRISNLELSMRYAQEGRVSGEVRVDKRFDEIRSAMLRIDGKIDLLIRDRSSGR
jgi:hypothetical protein